MVAVREIVRLLGLAGDVVAGQHILGTDFRHTASDEKLAFTWKHRSC